jgi:hypothetical protein
MRVPLKEVFFMNGTKLAAGPWPGEALSAACEAGMPSPQAHMDVLVAGAERASPGRGRASL